jgi:hypothetical protein
MKSVTLADGTVIAYQQQGSGPALILVDGALSTRDGKDRRCHRTRPPGG